MRVAALAEGLKHSSLEAGGPDRQITDITNDSRRVTKGALYAALPGLHVDGHRFIPDAIDSGAGAILCERLPRTPRQDVSWFVAPDARMALSELSDRFFGYPSRDIEVVGVTGTDGKTSTVYFIHQLLLAIAGSSSFLSTAAMQVGAAEEANALHQSTPEAPEVHRTLRTMADHGSRYAVLESTSHGLSHKTCRLAHVHYRVGVFTNLSHEHLEFHGTFERYRSDKANLFRSLESGFGVVNRDDENAGYFAEATRGEVIGYSVERDAEYRARDIELDATGSRFTLVTPSGTAACSLPIPGVFNVSNALAAAAAVQRLTGCTNERLADAIANLRSVRGRMTVVQGEPFSVVVDYAHTPGSFENVLPFFRRQCAGKLIVVFGSAGDRDVAKRPLQGAIADRYADAIVLADEDPRSEEPMAILREIASGCRAGRPGLHLIPDRREAIRRAFSLASAGDTVLLLGKGHETTIIGSAGEIPWDEIEVARAELRDYQ